MAGINPNLGNNLKLQNLQLSKTAKVDTQNNKGKEVGDAKPAAVWLRDGNAPSSEAIVTIQNPDIMPGDVIFYDDGPRRICVNYDGTLYLAKTEVSKRDFEANRGDVRR